MAQAMTAQEIETKMVAIIEMLPGFYQQMDGKRLVWQQADLIAEQEETKAYLIHKARPAMTVETAKQMAYEETHTYRMDAVSLEAEFRAAGHEVDVLEKELDIYRSLFSMERSKLEKNVEMGP